MAGEVHQGDGGDELELGGGIGHGLGVGLDELGDLGKLAVGDVLPAHAHPLVEADNEGGGVQSHLVARLLQDGRQHGRGGALAVGAGDMDELQGVLGIAQSGGQLNGPLQPGAAALPAGGVDEIKGLGVGHGDLLL